MGRDAMTSPAPSVPESPFAHAEQRDTALQLGMWVFLGSETMLFGGLFGLYAGYRSVYSAVFLKAAAHNEEWIGSVNTYVLIVSSFFVALAIELIRKGRRRACLLSLGLVMALGLTFLGLKGLEYYHHLSTGVAPGVYYDFAEMNEPGAAIFFTLYYFLTGLHALHVVVGLLFIGGLSLGVLRRAITAEQNVVLELGGLYWHLIDIMWIFIWPLLYLLE